MTDSVPFEIHDYAAGQGGLTPGYYFHVPDGDGEPTMLTGPFPTHACAVEGARDFIAELLQLGDGQRIEVTLENDETPIGENN